MTQEALIRGHFKNTLTADEQLQLEQLLQEDAAFKTLFEEHQDMHFAFLESEKQALKQHLQALSAKAPITENEEARPSAENPPSKPTTGDGRVVAMKWYQQNWLKYAIASVFVIGLFVLFMPKNQNADLYTTYFEAYPNVEAPVIRNSDGNIDAFLHYENQDYANAIAAFELLLAEENNPNIRFYFAMSLMNAGQLSAAKKELDALQQLPFDYQAEALWYNALIALERQDNATVIQNLKDLQVVDGQFNREAVGELLGKLGR